MDNFVTIISLAYSLDNLTVYSVLGQRELPPYLFTLSMSAKCNEMKKVFQKLIHKRSFDVQCLNCISIYLEKRFKSYLNALSKINRKTPKIEVIYKPIIIYIYMVRYILLNIFVKRCFPLN